MPNDALVSFRVIGDEVDPSVITHELGISPDRAHKRGDTQPKHPDKQYKTGLWSIDSDLGRAAPIEAHFARLVERLGPKTEVVRALASATQAIEFFCSCFSEEPTYKINLNSELLSRIGQMGIGIVATIYSSREDDVTERAADAEAEAPDVSMPPRSTRSATARRPTT
jgi:hypothetical protein